MLESFDALIAQAFSKAQTFEQQYGDCVPNLLLTLIAMELDDIRQRSIARPFQIVPVSIPTGQAGILVDTDTRGLSRRCVLWIDPITTGPIPEVRVHTSRSVNATAGGQGFPVQVGQANDLGVVDGDSQIFGIAQLTSPVSNVTGSVVMYSP